MRNATPRPSRGREAGAERRQTGGLRLRQILPYLSGVKPVRDGYMALCPCHDDSEPSLHLSERNGLLLVHCFAGCSQERVWAALLELARHDSRSTSRGQEQPESRPEGLSLEQYASSKRLDPELLKQWGLYDTRWNERPAVAIPYFDEQGNLIATRYRLAMEGANRFRWERGNRPSLYGLWRLPEWDTVSLLLAEGESDVHCCWTAGLPALGIPGAGVWQPEWWEKVSRFARVYIMPDSDAAGEQLLQRLAESCPETLRERVQVIRLPEGCKDCSELWLQTEADPQRFLQALRACERVPLAEWCEAEPEVRKPRFYTPHELLEEAGASTAEFLPFLGVDGLVAKGAVSLLVSSPKCGKTSLLLSAVLEWLQQGLRVCWLSEEPPAIWRERFRRLPELVREEFMLAFAEGGYAPDEWAQAVLEREPAVVIIDTAREFARFADENSQSDVSARLRPLVSLVHERPEIVLVLAHHMRKARGDNPTVDDVIGSVVLSALVDAVFTLVPCKENPRWRLLIPIASRIWGQSHEPLVCELPSDGSCYRIVGNAGEVLAQAEQQAAIQAVLQAVQAAGKATAQEIEEMLPEFSLRTVREALLALTREGKLERTGTGRKGDPYVYAPSGLLRHYCGTPINMECPNAAIENPPSELLRHSGYINRECLNAAIDAPSPPVHPQGGDDDLQVSDDELEQFARLLEESDSSASDDELTLWASML